MSRAWFQTLSIAALVLGAGAAEAQTKAVRPPTRTAVRPAATPQSFTCVEDAFTMCLNGGRFEVFAIFDTPQGASGDAEMVRLTDDSGYMWFFSSPNIEAVVKVVNGCAISPAYWFFAGGLTNVHVVITVTDSITGVSRQWENPQNTAFQPIQNTSALDVCP